MKRTIWAVKAMMMICSAAFAADMNFSQDKASNDEAIEAAAQEPMAEKAPAKAGGWFAKQVKQDSFRNESKSESKSSSQSLPDDNTAATEIAQKTRAIKTQEEWIEKLKKQLEGEIKQLEDMKKSLAEIPSN